MKAAWWLAITFLLLSPLRVHSNEMASPELSHPAWTLNTPLQQAIEYAKAGKFEWALPIFSRLAEEGDLEAQYHLALMYYHGEGMKPDLKAAFAWRLRAAKSGHAGAQADLGVMYDNGEGTKVDRREAARWYQASAEQDNPIGQRNLALSYLRGEGVSKDAQLAFKWFNVAAKNGDERSHRYVAELYERGEGTKRDVKEALRWYGRAGFQSDHSDRLAYLAMGKLYYSGRGAERDLVKAHMWFSFAAGAEWSEWRIVSNPHSSGYEARDFLKRTSKRLSPSQLEQATLMLRACYDAEDVDQAMAACGLQ
jgi:TPR repeat protein